MHNLRNKRTLSLYNTKRQPMETSKRESITIEASVKAPAETVWSAWIEPKHITQWCSASDDWHAPYAENDLRPSGRFKTTMAARDGSVQFDFSGQYTAVDELRHIAYTLDDGRTVDVRFDSNGDTTHIVQRFEAEEMNPIEMQRDGWQSILNNFKKYAESL